MIDILAATGAFLVIVTAGCVVMVSAILFLEWLSRR
jgi:hypothetical protein